MYCWFVNPVSPDLNVTYLTHLLSPEATSQPLRSRTQSSGTGLGPILNDEIIGGRKRHQDAQNVVLTGRIKDPGFQDKS